MIDETDGEVTSLIKTNYSGTLEFLGEEESSLQLSAQKGKAIHADRTGNIRIKTGDIWIQHTLSPSSMTNNSIQIGENASLEINVANDIVVLTDLKDISAISDQILNSGTLKLNAKRMFFGLQNTQYTNSTYDNTLLDLQGTVEIGGDNTELIALNGSRYGIDVGANLDSLSLQTKKLQIIGDKSQGSFGIYISGAHKKTMDFHVGDGYIANVTTGIGGASNDDGGSTSKMQFERLWNYASDKSIDLNISTMELNVIDTAYLDKDAEIKESNLTLNIGKYQFNNAVRLTEKSLLDGSASLLAAKQLIVENNSEVNLASADYVLGADSTNLNYAVLSSSGSEVNLNSQALADSVVQVENNLVATDNGSINANFMNKKSHFIGTALNSVGGTRAGEQGDINLAFKDGAYWRATASNTQSVDLTLNNADVYLDQTKEGQTESLTESNGKTLNLSMLDGDGGIFHMRTAVDGVYGDSINIETSNGTHQLMLAGSGAEPTDEALNRALVTKQEGSLDLSLANAGGKVESGLYFYKLADRTTADNAQEWYLIRDSIGPDNPDVPPTPETPTAQAVLGLSGLSSAYSMWMGQLSDLRERLGEIRYHTSDDGLWVRAYGEESELSGLAGLGFSQKYYGTAYGYDKLLQFDGNALLIGAKGQISHADQTLKNNFSGSGNNDSYGFAAYATWMHDDGWYIDSVLSWDHYDQTLRTNMLDGTSVRGDYEFYGMGASVEGGKTFRFDNNVFFEPQAQLSYYFIEGKDFVTSNGMTADQDNLDSLVGRFGMVLGKKWQLDENSFIQPYFKAGINYEFLGDLDAVVNDVPFSDDMQGIRAYYGVGLDYQAGDSVKIYGEFEREDGDNLTRPWSVSAGIRVMF